MSEHQKFELMLLARVATCAIFFIAVWLVVRL